MIGQSAGEKLAKITHRNNVYWSYFRINCVKTLFINLKSLELLKFFFTISGFSLGLDLSNHSWKLPLTSRETVPLNELLQFSLRRCLCISKKFWASMFEELLHSENGLYTSIWEIHLHLYVETALDLEKLQVIGQTQLQQLYLYLKELRTAGHTQVQHLYLLYLCFEKFRAAGCIQLYSYLKELRATGLTQLWQLYSYLEELRAAGDTQLEQRLPSVTHHGLNGLDVGEVGHVGWLKQGGIEYRTFRTSPLPTPPPPPAPRRRERPRECGFWRACSLASH